jgi:enoyl-CoA hydratase
MESDTRTPVRTERRGRVLLIVIDRPEARNAINGAVGEGLVRAVALLDDDDELTVGVLTGAPPVFCAGMDLKAFARGEDMSASGAFVRDGARKPLIAAVEGAALAGGLELALACDLIVAAADARLGIPEVTRGLLAGGGALLRLPALVGAARAMELALTGDPVTAARAHEIGLVARVAEPGCAVSEALRLAERVAANAPLGVAASKQVVRGVAGLTDREAWEFQSPIMESVFASADAQEGPRAFAEKRTPRWSGR